MPPKDGSLAVLETGFEGYPPEYVCHNVPFIILSGLTVSPSDGDQSFHLPSHYRDGALKVHGDLPPVSPSQAQPLLQALKEFERSSEQWDARPVKKGSNVTGFAFRTIGRNYELPPRKAKPPTQELGYEEHSAIGSGSPPLWILHSPISPLTPGSSVFPDGVIGPEWLQKHQHFIPSVFMSFFDFTSDPSTNSLTDNQLKTEINNIKATLYRSEYKTRLAVVLVGDETTSGATDVEDRLSLIRRATGLDNKTFFFLPPNSSFEEIKDFADGVFMALQPGCVEYYRDLTKHARRKKARGSIPAPTAPPTRGTSQTLSALGWGVRYDFKLGVLAEYRQEMESACRHYTSALESLLGPDGIFETTASWSPRWDEARMLADIVAMRILRCLLFSNLTTTAVQSWSNYRFRLRELVDRRGKGSSNYGWEAWESRWSRMMAELVKRAGLVAFVEAESQEYRIHAPIEKAIPVGERIRPFEHLHHSGYWFNIAAKHARRRRRLAIELPEDDCTPPGQSPASAMAARYGTYDTYLCPEPWQERPLPDRKTYNHSKEIFHTLEKSLKEFRMQPRSRSELCLAMTRELIRNRQYSEAMKLLYQLWMTMTWRKDQWWELVFEVTRSLRECAKELGDAKVLAATEFELHSNSLAVAKGLTYDLMNCGKDMARSEHKSLIGDDMVELDAERVTGCFDAMFTFESGQGHAGEPSRAQLVVVSKAQSNSQPVTFTKISIFMAGSPSAVIVNHEDQPAESVVQHLDMVDKEDEPKTAMADLRLHPGKSLILEMPLIFREPGTIAISRMVFTINTPAAVIQFTISPQEMSPRTLWRKQTPDGIVETPVARDDSFIVQIQPRPPKMEIKVPTINEHFYTDEEIEVPIELRNGETEDTMLSLDVRISSDDGPMDFQWLNDNGDVDSGGEGMSYRVGELAAGTSRSVRLLLRAPSLPTTYSIEVKAIYHVASDMSTQVSKTFDAELNVTRAFEANYDFEPRVHPTIWPSFFDPATVSHSDDTGAQHSIIQQWELLARIVSFTYEGIIMTKAELVLESISNHATATLRTLGELHDELEVAPQQQIDKAFAVEVMKGSLEDRRSVELELILAISWHRPRSNKIFTSFLPVNSFVLENGPRILASVSYPQLLKQDATEDELDDVSFAQLSFTLENPTNHFLSFELTMDGSQKEEWALSGPKMSSLNLLPLSREVVSYRIVPLSLSEASPSDGQWLEVKFRVMDVYFRKVLRVLPASAGVREVEGKGGSLLVWVRGHS